MKNLSETTELMNSTDYKDRFKAEYYQLETRLIKLHDMIDKLINNELTFTPICDKGVLENQRCYMYKYLLVLIDRAKLENIDLDIDDEVKHILLIK